MHSTPAASYHASAILSGVSANVILGFSSLYWKALASIPPTILLGYRILLSHELPAGTLPVLALCGAVSALPLWLFSLAAARLPLSVMGFFQFVLPTTQLFVALVFYRQDVSANTLWCFGAIWLALAMLVAEPLARRAWPARTNSA